MSMRLTHTTVMKGGWQCPEGDGNGEGFREDRGARRVVVSPFPTPTPFRLPPGSKLKEYCIIVYFTGDYCLRVSGIVTLTWYRYRIIDNVL